MSKLSIPHIHLHCHIRFSLLTPSLCSFFFLISILFQVLLARHHKREKRYGPSPANNYTYGSRRKWFWSRNKSNPETDGADALPGHPTPRDVEVGDVDKTNEKKWFGSWGRQKNAAANGTTNGAHAAGAQNGYGYGGSAYTGNY